MKNARIPLLVLTCIFAAFLLGLFLGRNQNPAPVQIQALPKATVAPAASEDGTEPNGTAPTAPTIVNINTATLQQLQQLPSIGPVLAERIIAYRDAHGSFATPTELLNVPGIGEKKLETIWDLVTTGG